MRYLPVLFLVMGSLTTGAAQTTFSWGFELFPHYGHRRLVASEAYTQTQIDSLETDERSRPSLGGGLYLSWRGQKAGFQVGLNYLNTGYRSPSKSYAPTDPEGINFDSYRQVYRSQQLEIPFSVHFYQAIDSRNELYFMFGGGLAVNIANDNIRRRFAGDNPADVVATEATENFRTLGFAFQSAMGWEHHLSPRLTLTAQPTFRFWLSGLYAANNEINRNLYQLGLRLGLRFNRVLPN